MMESKGAEAIGTEDETEEMELWNNAFGEVVRQVYVHCNERGHLLEAIRQKYVALLNRLMSGQSDAVEKMQAEASNNQAESDARDKAVKNAMMFTRAAHGMYRDGKSREMQLLQKKQKDERAMLLMEIDQLKSQLAVMRRIRS